MKVSNSTSLKITSLVFICLSMLYAASGGKITGRVIDSKTGEPLLGANIIIEGTGIGAASDLDGYYVINNTPPGSYTVLVSYIGYETQRITNLNISEEQIVYLNIALNPSSLDIGSVVVEVQADRSTESYLLIEQKKSDKIQDGVSAAQISRAGDSNAAEAAKRITGLTVVDDKYVYVRGLGDRYTTTVINGAPTPSPEPEKKTVPLNLFPTALLESITAIKTFTPDLPGVFAGGNVNIKTKAYPDELTAKLSTSTSEKTYPKKDQRFLVPNIKGKWDFFGFDDGTRSLPSELPKDAILSEWNSQLSDNSVERKKILGEIGKAFETDFTPKEGRALQPISLGFNIGNRYAPTENFEWGFFLNTTFSNDFAFRKASVNEYSMISSGLNPKLGMDSEKSQYNTNLGATLSGGFKLFNKHKLSFYNLYTHRSEDYIEYSRGFADNFDDGIFIKDYYVEKSIENFTVSGIHQINFLADQRVEWSVNRGESELSQPDFKGLNYRVKKKTNGEEQEYYQMDTYSWSAGTRDFTDGYDKNNSFDINYYADIKDRLGDVYKIKLGAHLQENSRDFVSRSFYHRYASEYGGSAIPLDITVTYNIDDIGKSLNDDNCFYVDEEGNVHPGLIVAEGTNSTDAYKSQENIDAAYFMVDIPLSFGIIQPLRNVRFIGGLRREDYKLDLEPYHPISYEPFVSPITGDTVTANIDEMDYLPSYNLLIQLPNDFNIRASYSQTVARAEFREIAPYEFQNFYGSEILVGYPYLKTTDIQNYDLRFEWFRDAGEILALSLFRKDFENPIEAALIEASGKVYKTFQNAKEANSIGLEFDSRVDLDFIPIQSGKVSFLMNFTLTNSEVTVDSTVTIFTGYSVENEATSYKRPLQGQSDFVINLGFNYTSFNGLNLSLFCNSFSERLVSLGVATIPDEYEMPFHSLNFTISKKYNRFKVSAKVKNILNSKVEIGHIDPASDEFKSTEIYKPGQSVSLGISYDL